MGEEWWQGGDGYKDRVPDGLGNVVEHTSVTNTRVIAIGNQCPKLIC